MKEKYALFALEWCNIHFGKCKRKRRELIFELNPKKKINKRAYYGYYCFYRNKLTVCINNCETLLDIVQTVIHEYTHYLQSRTKYEYYLKVYSYSTNPYEKEAKKNELIYGKECLKTIKNQLKISNSKTSFK